MIRDVNEVGLINGVAGGSYILVSTSQSSGHVQRQQDPSPVLCIVPRYILIGTLAAVL